MEQTSPTTSRFKVNTVSVLTKDPALMNKNLLSTRGGGQGAQKTVSWEVCGFCAYCTQVCYEECLCGRSFLEIATAKRARRTIERSSLSPPRSPRPENPAAPEAGGKATTDDATTAAPTEGGAELRELMDQLSQCAWEQKIAERTWATPQRAVGKSINCNQRQRSPTLTKSPASSRTGRKENAAANLGRWLAKLCTR